MEIYPLIDAFALRQDGTKPLIADWNAGAYDITTAGTVQAEQLTSTDDINATDDITAGGTVTAEQITSTDDITMLGHILTLGDGSAADPSIFFTGLSNNAAITFDESVPEFEVAAPIIVSKVTVEELFYTTKIENTGILKIYNEDTNSIIDGDPALNTDRTLILRLGNYDHITMGVGATGGTADDLDIGVALGTHYAYGSWTFATHLYVDGDLRLTDSARGIAMKNNSGNTRYGLKYGAAGSLGGDDILALTNRESNGEISIQCNTAVAGAAGETEVIRCADDLVSVKVASDFGDGGSNKSAFATNGIQTMAGTARVTRHLWVSATSMKKDGAADDTDGIGAHVIFRAGQTDEVRYSTHVPYRRAANTDMIVILVWYYTAGNENVNCEWNLSYQTYAISGGDPTGNGTALAEQAVSIDAEHKTGTVTFTIPAVALTNHDTLQYRIWRDGTNDALTQSALLLGTHVHFTMDKLGLAT